MNDAITMERAYIVVSSGLIVYDGFFDALEVDNGTLDMIASVWIVALSTLVSVKIVVSGIVY